jgi:hypothetical protein
VFYDDLLISLEAKFSRSRAYSEAQLDVEALLKKSAPILAARVVEKGEWLCSVEE